MAVTPQRTNSDGSLWRVPVTNTADTYSASCPASAPRPGSREQGLLLTGILAGSRLTASIARLAARHYGQHLASAHRSNQDTVEFLDVTRA